MCNKYVRVKPFITSLESTSPNSKLEVPFIVAVKISANAIYLYSTSNEIYISGAFASSGNIKPLGAKINKQARHEREWWTKPVHLLHQ